MKGKVNEDKNRLDGRRQDSMSGLEMRRDKKRVEDKIRREEESSLDKKIETSRWGGETMR